MGKKSAGKPPAAPDPATVINLQSGENRTNTYTPFGSSEWVIGPDGRPSQETSASPALQAVANQAFGNALTPNQRVEYPMAFETLGRALVARLGNRYGVDPNARKPDPNKRVFAPPQSVTPVDAMYGSTGAAPLPYTPPTPAKGKG